MLNPECVDYAKNEKNAVDVCFSDPIDDGVLSIRLGFKEAFDLGKMLIEKTNMKAKEKYKG